MAENMVLAATAARVAAKLREVLDGIDRVAAQIAEALADYPREPEPDTVITHGFGGLLHDFYTGIESAFNQVSPHLNGELPAGDAWHRELLHSMTLDLPGIRPPVVSQDSEQRLITYLRFRHLYRHKYGSRLEWARVRELAEEAEPIWETLRSEIDAFLVYLDALVKAVPASADSV